MSFNRDLIRNLKYTKATGFDAELLAKTIEEGYLEQKRPDGFVQKKSFAPSSIGGYSGLCPRRWYIAFTGAESENNTDALGVANMANGTDAHVRIQKLLKEKGVLVAEEVPVELKDPPVFGYIDVLVRQDNEIVVGEIKTANMDAFNLRQAARKPTFPHLMQVLIYMKATGKKQGFVLYENKNDQSLLILPIDMNETNEALLEKTLQWLRDVYANYQAAGEEKWDHLPLRPFTKSSLPCKTCDFFNECWNKLPVGTIDFPAMEVPSK